MNALVVGLPLVGRPSLLSRALRRACPEARRTGPAASADRTARQSPVHWPRLRRVALLLTLAATWAVRGADVAPKMLLLDGAAVGPDLVVVGELGTILRSSDQAHTWQAAPVATRATLTGVAFA